MKDVFLFLVHRVIKFIFTNKCLLFPMSKLEKHTIVVLGGGGVGKSAVTLSFIRNQ